MEKFKDVPVIIFSDLNHSDDVKYINMYKADGLLHNPKTEHELCEATFDVDLIIGKKFKNS